jgi:N4-gp56 family major capsid protein
LAKTDLTATISFYGDYVHVTDVVDLTVEDAVLTETAELLGEQMGETVDEIIRDILAACASSTNASGGSNGSTPTEVVRSDIDGVMKTLLNANAKMITRVITATTGVGTSPVRPAFMGIMSTACVDDLEGVTGFKSIADYPKQSGIMEAEWGATGGVRWLITVKGYSTGSPVQYYSMIFGQNAYGITELTAATAKNIVKGFGTGGTDDPLNQRATSGWKTAFTSRILNDNFMHILRQTHS